jgi:multiple sugar transport system ATP-binding protein
MNFIDAKIVEKGGRTFVQFQDVSLPLTTDKAAYLKEKGYVGKEVVFGIRPENLHDEEKFMAENPESVTTAKVEVTELMGSETYLYLKVAGADAIARVDASSKAKAEETIKLGFDMTKIHMFDKETELSIF